MPDRLPPLQLQPGIGFPWGQRQSSDRFSTGQLRRDMESKVGHAGRIDGAGTGRLGSSVGRRGFDRAEISAQPAYFPGRPRPHSSQASGSRVHPYGSGSGDVRRVLLRGGFLATGGRVPQSIQRIDRCTFLHSCRRGYSVSRVCGVRQGWAAIPERRIPAYYRCGDAAASLRTIARQSERSGWRAGPPSPADRENLDFKACV